MEDIFTPEEKDEVLKECKNTNTEYFFSPIEGHDEQFARKKAILRVLYLDGYMGVANTSTGGIVYRLTYDGLCFRNWGGYTRLSFLIRHEEERKVDEQRNWELLLKKHERSTQKKILIWSSIVTVINTMLSYLISPFL